MSTGSKTRLKILLSAFACRPNAGSEWGVGWNFFNQLSKHHEVHLITELEFKDEILVESNKLKIPADRIHFVDIGKTGRRKLHNQGDWSFYYYYRSWQMKALQKGCRLHDENEFDIAHHLNMIGFREPGSLHKLDIPFILGPLGGFGGVPNNYFEVGFGKQRLKNKVKTGLNYFSMFLPHVRAAIRHADCVIAAYPEAAKALAQHFNVLSTIIPETGSTKVVVSNTQRKNFIWIGKNLVRKQFQLAAEAFLRSQISRSEKLFVIGKFQEDEIAKWSRNSNIVFLGEISRIDVLTQLSNARALIFSSLHEGNPHVVYEAISTFTPIICHNSYGMGFAVDESIGIKIEVANYKNSLVNFSDAIDQICLMNFSENDFKRVQENNSWENRVAKINMLYKEVISKTAMKNT